MLPDRIPRGPWGRVAPGCSACCSWRIWCGAGARRDSGRHRLRWMGPGAGDYSGRSGGSGAHLGVASHAPRHPVSAFIRQDVRLRLASEAAGQVGIFGQVCGDAWRVAGQGAELPVAERITSVALDRALYTLSSTMVTIAGIASVAFLLPLPGKIAVSRMYSVSSSSPLCCWRFSPCQALGFHLRPGGGIGPARENQTPGWKAGGRRFRP